MCGVRENGEKRSEGVERGKQGGVEKKELEREREREREGEGERERLHLLKMHIQQTSFQQYRQQNSTHIEIDVLYVSPRFYTEEQVHTHTHSYNNTTNAYGLIWM